MTSLATPTHTIGAHAITLPCGTALQLLPQRALWWPAARMVMVADVHFGKAATFRRAGQPVPHGTTADNLARLDALLAATGADHLVFLGDFLHARSGAADALWQQLLPWRQRHARVAMTLVRGNHDQHAGDPPAALALALALAVLLLGWGLRSLWARLTGRRVAPFVMRIDPRDGFGQVYRRAGGVPGGAGRGNAATTLHDVTDVEPKSPRR